MGLDRERDYMGIRRSERSWSRIRGMEGKKYKRGGGGGEGERQTGWGFGKGEYKNRTEEKERKPRQTLKTL